MYKPCISYTGPQQCWSANMNKRSTVNYMYFIVGWFNGILINSCSMYLPKIIFKSGCNIELTDCTHPLLSSEAGLRDSLTRLCLCLSPGCLVVRYINLKSPKHGEWCRYTWLWILHALCSYLLASLILTCWLSVGTLGFTGICGIERRDKSTWIYHQNAHVHTDYPMHSMQRIVIWLVVHVLYMSVKNVQKSTQAAFLSHLDTTHECDGKLLVHSRLKATPVSLLMLVCPIGVWGQMLEGVISQPQHISNALMLQ